MIMPSLVKFQGPMVVTDIKGELSEYYVKHAKSGVNKPCIIFDPTDPETICYDPFGSINGNDEAELVSSMREIALILIPERLNSMEPFWDDSERAILTAALIYYYKLELSFSETLGMILAPGLTTLCEKLLKSDDDLVKSYLGEVGNLKSSVRANIDAGLRSKLTPIATDPYIAHAFRGSREGAKCFSGKDIEKYSIFIRIPGDKIERWGKSINMIYTQLIHYLERRPEKYSEEGSKIEPTLILMDEFARFGKLDAIIPAISTLRSKKVNICLVLQSHAQLDMIYGEAARRVILDNCQYQAILSANDAETQRILSERIGTTKRMQKSISNHYDDLSDISGYSEQISSIREPIVQSHELATMKDIILLTPDGNFRVDKIPPESTPENEKEPLETMHNIPVVRGRCILANKIGEVIDEITNSRIDVQGRTILVDENGEVIDEITNSDIDIQGRTILVDKNGEVIDETTNSGIDTQGQATAVNEKSEATQDINDTKNKIPVVQGRCTLANEIAIVLNEAKNREAKMLTYNERVKSAKRKAGIAEYQCKIARRDENKAPTDIDTWQNTAIGFIVCKYIPEFSEIGLNSGDDCFLSVDDVERFFRILTSDEELMADLKSRADIDFLEPSGL